MKPVVVRVVTADYVVPWHLDNTLPRMTRDFEVHVVGKDVSRNAARYPGVHWTDVDLNRKVSPLADLRALWQLTRLLKRLGPSIVHSIMPKAGLLAAIAARLAGVPVRMHTFTGQVWAGRSGPGAVLLRAADRLVNALNTTCLTDSPSQSRFLLRFGIGHRGAPLPVLGSGSLSGVNLARFAATGGSRAEVRAALGLSDAFVFAFIARKSRDKGAFDLLDAFARVYAAHPGARLLFVGPDESAGELAALPPARLAGVVSHGPVTDHERYLAAADVLCLPSYREGFGSIVIDAAAAGLPAIGSGIDGLVDAIEPGVTGLLVPPGDVNALAAAMEGLARDPARCREMGRAARERVEQEFSADRLYLALRDFYAAQLAALAPAADPDQHA